MLKQAVTTTMVLFFAVSLSAAETPENKTGVSRLFILSGQSNMVGLDPALSFVPELEKAFPDDEIVLVKDAHNGQPLSRWFAREKPRDLYKSLMEKVNKAVEGKEFASVTFVWMQGEADGSWKEDSGRYETHLKGLIAQLRSDLKRDDMTVVVGRISDFANGQKHWDKVREVQVAVAEADPLAGWIDTDDLNGDKNDKHYTAKEDKKTLGTRFAQKAIALIRHQSQTHKKENADG